MVGDTALRGIWTFGARSSLVLDTFPSVAKTLTALIVGALDRLAQARELNRARRESRYFRERERRHYLFEELVTESPTMKAVYAEVNRMVREASTVWILGEKGTGKEMVARALHHLSNRSTSLMISQNCATLDEDELDVELFGRSESSTEGEGRPGLLELTSGGTLFLEEIGRLPLALQAKLSRAISEREVRPRGGAIARPVNLRLVVSSEQDLFEPSTPDSFDATSTCSSPGKPSDFPRCAIGSKTSFHSQTYLSPTSRRATARSLGSSTTRSTSSFERTLGPATYASFRGVSKLPSSRLRQMMRWLGRFLGFCRGGACLRPQSWTPHPNPLPEERERINSLSSGRGLG